MWPRIDPNCLRKLNKVSNRWLAQNIEDNESVAVWHLRHSKDADIIQLLSASGIVHFTFKRLQNSTSKIKVNNWNYVNHYNILFIIHADIVICISWRKRKFWECMTSPWLLISVRFSHVHMLSISLFFLRNITLMWRCANNLKYHHERLSVSFNRYTWSLSGHCYISRLTMVALHEYTQNHKLNNINSNSGQQMKHIDAHTHTKSAKIFWSWLWTWHAYRWAIFLFLFFVKATCVCSSFKLLLLLFLISLCFIRFTNPVWAHSKSIRMRSFCQSTPLRHCHRVHLKHTDILHFSVRTPNVRTRYTGVL